MGNLATNPLGLGVGPVGANTRTGDHWHLLA